MDRDPGKAVPYGIYDLVANTGWVNVGTDHDTAGFAVESIRRWWNGAGHGAYPNAGRLLITADAGGSNSYRTRAWKAELAALATEIGMPITICHLPPGTSKWNKIEHRLFCHITMNWRGHPLTSHEVIVESIAATTTGTGLTVHAQLDTGHYPTGVEVSDETMAALPISRHDFHGDWNYTLNPVPAPTLDDPGNREAPRQPAKQDPTGLDRDMLSHPTLTGISRQQLQELTLELAKPQAAQREHDRHTRRGTERRRAAGGGPHPKLAPADRVLATILYLRKLCTQTVLGELFAVTRSSVTRAVTETQELLQQHGHTVTPSTARFPAPSDLIAFLARTTAAPSEIKTAC